MFSPLKRRILGNADFTPQDVLGLGYARIACEVNYLFVAKIASEFTVHNPPRRGCELN